MRGGRWYSHQEENAELGTEALAWVERQCSSYEEGKKRLLKSFSFEASRKSSSQMEGRRGSFCACAIVCGTGKKIEDGGRLGWLLKHLGVVVPACLLEILRDSIDLSFQSLLKNLATTATRRALIG